MADEQTTVAPEDGEQQGEQQQEQRPEQPIVKAYQAPDDSLMSFKRSDIAKMPYAEYQANRPAILKAQNAGLIENDLSGVGGK